MQVIAFDGVVPFELAMPCQIFGRATVPGQKKPYDIRVCGEAAYIKSGAFDLRVPFGFDDVTAAHTVIVPGIADPAASISAAVMAALRAAAARGARIASICTGAFVLAASGLLDGRRATTHWRAAHALATLFPAIQVDADVLYVDEGQILTSAGAAGMDLCLHMLRRDHGAAVAADAARLAVMPLERDGGQAQFIIHAPPSSGTTLAPVLQWMLTARVRRAQELLEATQLSVEQVALQVGLDSAVTLRDRFSKELSISPTGYRRAMGGTSAGHPSVSQVSQVQAVQHRSTMASQVSNTLLLSLLPRSART